MTYACDKAKIYNSIKASDEDELNHPLALLSLRQVTLCDVGSKSLN